MSRIAPGVVVLLLAVAAMADDKSKPRPSPAERLAALQKQRQQAEAAYFKAASPLPDTPEGNRKAQELWQAFDKKQADLFLQAVAIARTAPQSDVGFAALEWVLTIPRAYYLAAGKPAMELAAEHHATNPKIGKLIAMLGRVPLHEKSKQHAAAMALIRAVAEENPDKATRAQAALALAWQASSRFAAAEYRQEADADGSPPRPRRRSRRC